MEYIEKDSKYARWFSLTKPEVQKCYFQGNIKYLSQSYKRICIVGSRKMTNYGRQVLEYLIPYILSQNMLVVSGGAFGVDIYAHQLVRQFQSPGVVVLPSSLEHVYPKQNQSTIQYFASQGLILSENQKVRPNKYDFIARNRIMAAIADLVVIIEAAKQSGSLHTANFALENGINVAAIPGEIFSPQSKGCNQLISNGAHLILEPKDILNLI